MSLPAHQHQPKDEEMPLNTVKECNEKEDTNNGYTSIQMPACCHPAASWCRHNHYRRLAISSVICGLTCIGIVALTNSVKAKMATGPERAQFSLQARKYGIISIAVWVSLLVGIPLLVILISYLLTLID